MTRKKTNDQIKINRLIIIGNGFDLAHGMETSYVHFITNYLNEVITKFESNGYYDDPLINISGTEYYIHKKKTYSNPLIYWNDTITKTKGIQIKYNSNLFQRTLNDILRCRWVDIESKYFRMLSKAATSSSNETEVENSVNKLNTEFEYLKSKLIAYLKSQDDNITINDLNRKFLGCSFMEPIELNETTYDLKKYSEVNNYLFLNFNYTYLLEKLYFDFNGLDASKIIYIHGDLNAEKAEPIFGYGDDIDSSYNEIEKKGKNQMLKHQKSTQYLKSSNYYNLFRFLDECEFQVKIYGHSCGLSDRTMFHNIFEHKNCISIKLHYHQKDDGTDDFEEKTQELSRHFLTNKHNFRTKVVSKDKSAPFPSPLKN